jgi:hypothetical protein
VLKVARCKDARQRRSEGIRTVHLGRTRGRDRRDLAKSKVRRVKAQGFGVKGREAAKRREDHSHPYEEDRWQRSERSRELGSSLIDSPRIGYYKS